MNALTTGMEMMVGDMTMIAVIEVDAARWMRLKLHQFGSFGDGEALIV